MGDRVALAIGDAVGKGIPAALLIAGVRATLRAGSDDEPPADMLARVNRAMARDAQPGEFATVLCASRGW
jgi:serine phosphatase RsbU (regulator of sigma subunit)